ncbi:protein kinase domain-containing protein [Actinacidiphila paucisporea]|uniref:Serine/threonine protein kinase n=1 Tax=Actinacidiphila paucisporea TaxID=310782 RepID=A0A1M7NLF2_9ACTN|nr:serine/threonine-protein kinase [Actinacidiphila paucisporea]SHN04686.1 serine/threonine protein kinase [Actinacidiphila paucisporea]
MDRDDNVLAIGPYKVERKLGSGGMGVVYLATSPTGRRVAVKVVRERYAADPVFRLRFAREVAAARTVSGAFTAPVVDADTTGPTPWMATLFIPGPTLADHVAARGPLDLDALLRLAAGLIEALRDIHRVGLIHRDLKPSNVLMTDDGPRVIDFGITRAIDADTLTKTGDVIGTPLYMAPEQFRTPKGVDQAADIFALGAVLTFASTGRGPFDGENSYAVAWNVVHEPPTLDGVPSVLIDIVESCLAKDSAQRPNPEDLLAHLSDRSPLSVTRGVRGAWRRRLGALSLIATVTVVVLLAATGVWFLGHKGNGHTGASVKPQTTTPRATRPAIAGPLHEGEAALRPKGWALWETYDSLGGDNQANECAWVRPYIICDLISGSVVAYDSRSGKVAWTAAVGKFESLDFEEAPEGDSFFTVQDGSRSAPDESVLTVRDSVTGRARWHTSVSFVVDTFMNHGLIVAAIGKLGSSELSKVVAWDTKTGAQRWTHSFGNLSVNALKPAGDRIIASGDHGADSPFDMAGLDLSTGRQRWVHSRGKENPSYIGATPNLAVFPIYRPDSAIVVAVDLVDPATGQAKRITLGEPATESMTLDGTSLYSVRSDGLIRAYNLTTGSVRWTVDMGAESDGILLVSDQRVYAQTLTSEIDCRDADTGHELWRSAPRRDPNMSLTESLPHFRPVVTKGVVYALSARNSVFAIEPPDVPAAPDRSTQKG